MILAINSSTPTLELWLDDTRWDIETNRDLARDLLQIIRDRLNQTDEQLTDQQLFKKITGIVVFRGPGSFTGLRIGITVANALADSLGIPIVGEGNSNWLETGRERLSQHENDRLILPLYGAPANISQPRK